MIHHGIYLTWQDVCATIKNKSIIRNVSGYCVPGSMLAIMGPSGAGKTTLLSILAGKISSGVKVSGKVLANNTQYNRTSFYNFGSFVYQNDILSQALTVKQTLQFTARLKLVDKQKASNRLQQLIRDFGLQKCQDSYVGGHFIKGISGGQKKRLCIALQMVCKPDLLILDQPTSGLDSHMANNIISIFKKLTEKQNKTIIFTIHQPSYKIFSGLDRLLLLDKGECIYQGRAPDILQYMESLNIQMSKKLTICDHFMYQISQYKQKMIKNYQTPLNNSNYLQRVSPKIRQEIHQQKQISPEGYSKSKPASSFFLQFLLLFKRQFKQITRNWMKFGRVLCTSIFMVLIIGLVFKNRVSDDRPHIKQIYSSFPLLNFYFIQAQGTFFITATCSILQGIFSVALIFPIQRQIYFKQTASKTYKAFPYYLSKLLIQAVSIIICITVYGSAVYWLLGYCYDKQKFFKFLFLLCSLGIMGNSIGLFTSSLFRTVSQSSSLTPTLIIPFMLFSGLHNKLDSIPKWIAWFQYVSPFRYGLQSLLVNQFTDQIYQFQLPFGRTGIYDYQKQFSVNLTYWQNIGCVYACALGFYIIGYILLVGLRAKLVA